MTNKELQDKLKQFPDDCPVGTLVHDNGANQLFAWGGWINKVEGPNTKGQATLILHAPLCD